MNSEELASLYRSCDVLVCLSDHEGFCVPLLEAMSHRVPVVAFAAAAVPETLGDAGLLIHNKSPVTVACGVRRLLVDEQARRRLAHAGRRRVDSLTGAARSRGYCEVFSALRSETRASA